MSSCLLCSSESIASHEFAHGRPYVTCMDCGLIFVPPLYHPDRSTERSRYETHENDPSDKRYRAFLRRAEAPLLEHLEPPATGLDYGAGPGPTLSVMLEERGFDMEIYDPFFAPSRKPLAHTYDFITCTETAEHFHDPAAEFERLYALLRPGGCLLVMTIWADERNFKSWRYARDVTHVCFYRRRTIQWIADRFGYRLNVLRRGVALFRKAA